MQVLSNKWESKSQTRIEPGYSTMQLTYLILVQVWELLIYGLAELALVINLYTDDQDYYEKATKCLHISHRLCGTLRQNQA